MHGNGSHFRHAGGGGRERDRRASAVLRAAAGGYLRPHRPDNNAWFRTPCRPCPRSHTREQLAGVGDHAHRLAGDEHRGADVHVSWLLLNKLDSAKRAQEYTGIHIEAGDTGANLLAIAHTSTRTTTPCHDPQDSLIIAVSQTLAARCGIPLTDHTMHTTNS
jgi:hypothetical protein